MPPKYASLRNEKAFPRFTDLPDEDSINTSYLRSPDGLVYQPRRHWCLLAEIERVVEFGRVVLEVKDKAGTRLKVAFYTDERGYEWKTPQVKPGRTIAVLYPYKHAFMDMSTGIRLEKSDTVKLIPSTLENLIRLSDDVQTRSLFAGSNQCHGCNQEKESLQRCARCGLAWYCSKECQAVGWNEKGHQADCKVLRDGDLQGMLKMKWNHFEDYKAFPLS